MHKEKHIGLVLSFQTGISEEGEPIVSKASVNNLRLDLTNDEITEIAELMASLVKHTLVDIVVVKSYNII